MLEYGTVSIPLMPLFNLSLSSNSSDPTIGIWARHSEECMKNSPNAKNINLSFFISLKFILKNNKAALKSGQPFNNYLFF